MTLNIRPASETRWDCASFGEVMLRFDPGFGRVRNARSFQVWEGGGEYNVARAMRKCWGKRAAVVTALNADQIDMAWLGGFTFVQASQRGKVVPLVQREEDSRFTSKYIVNADSGISKLQQLKGKSFAFGSASSTSGHLMPRYFLQKQHIKPETFFKSVGYSGAHDATVAWVASGKVDAGVLNASVWDKLVEAGKVDQSKVKLLGTTPPYFDYNWTVRGSLDKKLQQKIQQAFLKLNAANPEHKAILELQRASKFIPTKAANYKGIEAAAKEAGLLQ